MIPFYLQLRSVMVILRAKPGPDTGSVSSAGASRLCLRRAAVCVAELEDAIRFYNTAFGLQLLANLDAPQAPRAALATGAPHCQWRCPRLLVPAAAIFHMSPKGAWYIKR